MNTNPTPTTGPAYNLPKIIHFKKFSLIVDEATIIDEFESHYFWDLPTSDRGTIYAAIAYKHGTKTANRILNFLKDLKENQ
jgi:hypothetical protein